MRKNDVFVWLFIVVLIAGQIGAQLRIARNERAVVGVALLAVAGNTKAQDLVHDLARTSAIQDEDTRNLLSNRAINKYVPKELLKNEAAYGSETY